MVHAITDLGDPALDTLQDNMCKFKEEIQEKIRPRGTAIQSVLMRSRVTE